MTPLAPPIVHDVSCVTRINQESHFVWQAQYLVMLEGDTSCCVHCKSCFTGGLIMTVIFRGSHDVW